MRYLLLIGGLLLGSGQVAATNFVPISNEKPTYQIDLESIQRSGNIVNYRIRLVPWYTGTGTPTAERFVVADCVEWRRAEFFATPTDQNPYLYTVFKGTTPDTEMSIACGNRPSSAQAQPAPTTNEGTPAPFAAGTIEPGSIAIRGDLTTYRINPGGRTVVANCTKRMRAVFSGPAPSAPQLFDVYLGTDEDAELRIACNQDGTAGRVSSTPASPSSPPAEVSPPAKKSPYSGTVKVETVRRLEGDLIIYKIKVMAPNLLGESRPAERFVVADCRKRMRSMELTVAPVSTPTMGLIWPNTGQAEELTIACDEAARQARAQSAKVPSAPQADASIPPAPPVKATPPQPVLPAFVPPTRPPKSTGSGFVVMQGYVVTNDHVVKDCRRLVVRRGKERYDAKLKTFRSRIDLALLNVPALTGVSVPGIRRNALLGEDVVVAGHPLSGLLSSDVIVTSGHVNALSGMLDNPNLLQISAPVQPGSSGGPLIDGSGNIVGVVVSKLNVVKLQKLTGDISQNVNFAIKAEILREFLDNAKIDYQLTVLGNRLENHRIAQSAREFTVQVECY